MNKKPLNRKNYGSIPHLKGSRLGPKDYHCTPGQEDIATKKTRDRWDLVIVQEKLDGSNVGVAKVNDEIVALTRAGYLASDSKYYQHRAFAEFVKKEERRFYDLLKEGERVAGEWLLVAHGTMYKLDHEPFVPFDIMMADKRTTYMEFVNRVLPRDFVLPNLIHIGQPIAIKHFESVVGNGNHGATEKIEGGIWRVERKQKVDFLIKYVRDGKEDGKYLEDDKSVFNQVLPEHEYLIERELV